MNFTKTNFMQFIRILNTVNFILTWKSNQSTQLLHKQVNLLFLSKFKKILSSKINKEVRNIHYIMYILFNSPILDQNNYSLGGLKPHSCHNQVWLGNND